jgi:hypothetical protein
MRATLENSTKIQEEFAQLKAKNEEKDVTIKSNEQSIFLFLLRLLDSFYEIYLFFSVISYLNKQLNDLQLRPEKTMASTPPWFSTPNEGNGGAAARTPNVPVSTLRGSPMQLGPTVENR